MRPAPRTPAAALVASTVLSSTPPAILRPTPDAEPGHTSSESVALERRYRQLDGWSVPVAAGVTSGPPGDDGRAMSTGRPGALVPADHATQPPAPAPATTAKPISSTAAAGSSSVSQTTSVGTTPSTATSTTAVTTVTTSPASSLTTTGSTTPPSPTTITGDNGPCFQPMFRDDFNGSALSDNWLVYTTNGNHSPHAVRRAEAVSVANGLLHITAKNDAQGVLASGGLRHRGSQTYGRYSVRVRTDADMHNATSGVVLTWPTSNNQPRDGENNFYETLKAPGARRPFYSFIHEPFDDRADGISQKRFVHDGDGSQWQEITMEWTPQYVSVKRSGPGSQSSQTHRIEETADDAITDAAHFLSIQLDLFKGSFPDDRQVAMQVDWVEISSYCGS